MAIRRLGRILGVTKIFRRMRSLAVSAADGLPGVFRRVVAILTVVNALSGTLSTVCRGTLLFVQGRGPDPQHWKSEAAGCLRSSTIRDPCREKAETCSILALGPVSSDVELIRSITAVTRIRTSHSLPWSRASRCGHPFHCTSFPFSISYYCYNSFNGFNSTSRNTTWLHRPSQYLRGTSGIRARAIARPRLRARCPVLQARMLFQRRRLPLRKGKHQ